MNISNPSSPASVWTFAPRTLTGFGGAITPSLGLINGTLAGGSTALIAVFTTNMEFVTFVGTGLQNVSWNIGLQSGSTFQVGFVGTPGGVALQTLVSTSVASAAIQNGGSVAGTYAYSRLQLRQT